MKNKKQKKKDEEIKDLVIERLQVLPSGKRLSIGSSRESFNKEELIKHIEKGDKIGEKIIEAQMAFLQSLKEGIFYEQDTSNYKAKA